MSDFTTELVSEAAVLSYCGATFLKAVPNLLNPEGGKGEYVFAASPKNDEILDQFYSHLITKDLYEYFEHYKKMTTAMTEAKRTFIRKSRSNK